MADGGIKFLWILKRITLWKTGHNGVLGHCSQNFLTITDKTTLFYIHSFNLDH